MLRQGRKEEQRRPIIVGGDRDKRRQRRARSAVQRRQRARAGDAQQVFGLRLSVEWRGDRRFRVIHARASGRIWSEKAGRNRITPIVLLDPMERDNGRRGPCRWRRHGAKPPSAAIPGLFDRPTKRTSAGLG